MMSCAYEYGGRDGVLEIWPGTAMDTTLVGDLGRGGSSTGLAPVAVRLSTGQSGQQCICLSNDGAIEGIEAHMPDNLQQGSYFEVFAGDCCLSEKKCHERRAAKHCTQRAKH